LSNLGQFAGQGPKIKQASGGTGGAVGINSGAVGAAAGASRDLLSNSVEGDLVIREEIQPLATSGGNQVVSATDTTTTSTSYVDLDSMTITDTPVEDTTGYFIFYSSWGDHDGAGQDIFIRLYKDAVAVTGTVQVCTGTNAGDSVSFSMSLFDSAPTFVSHTYNIKWQTGSGTATMHDRIFQLQELRR